MSDLAKKCAEQFRGAAVIDRAFEDSKTGAENDALAAFIERAQACRMYGLPKFPCTHCEHEDCALARAHDAALRDLAQAMEVE